MEECSGWRVLQTSSLRQIQYTGSPNAYNDHRRHPQLWRRHFAGCRVPPPAHARRAWQVMPHRRHPPALNGFCDIRSEDSDRLMAFRYTPRSNGLPSPKRCTVACRPQWTMINDMAMPIWPFPSSSANRTALFTQSHAVIRAISLIRHFRGLLSGRRTGRGPVRSATATSIKPGESSPNEPGKRSRWWQRNDTPGTRRRGRLPGACTARSLHLQATASQTIRLKLIIDYDPPSIDVR